MEIIEGLKAAPLAMQIYLVLLMIVPISILGIYLKGEI